MILLRWLVVALLCLSAPASAFWQSRNSNYNVAVAGAAGYTGPGDVVASATAWFGLRAYSASAAASTVKAINLRNANTAETCDVLVTTAGNLSTTVSNCSGSTTNGTSIASWAGTDATCTGTIASATLTLTSCSSGTPHVNDVITGTGITQPAYIVAIGSCAGGSGTCTLNASQTVSVGETITMTVAMLSPKLYDQTGNNHDVAQATQGNQAVFLQNCINSLPCLGSYQNASGADMRSSGNITPATGVVSYSVVINKITTDGATHTIIRENGSSGGNRLTVTGDTTHLTLVGGTSGNFTGSASNGAWHAIQAIVNGANSNINVDNTDNTGTATGNTTAGVAQIFIGGNSVYFLENEWGIWDNVVFSPTNNTNMCHNQYVYWGTSASC